MVSVENIKGYECKPTPISKPSRLKRKAIDIGNTTEETVNVNETYPVPVKQADPAAENTEK